MKKEFKKNIQKMEGKEPEKKDNNNAGESDDDEETEEEISQEQLDT